MAKRTKKTVKKVAKKKVKKIAKKKTPKVTDVLEERITASEERVSKLVTALQTSKTLKGI